MQQTTKEKIMAWGYRIELVKERAYIGINWTKSKVEPDMLVLDIYINPIPFLTIYLTFVRYE